MEESPIKFADIDINEILKTLPHRNPFLLIDRVRNIRADYSGIGVKNVSFNEPCFQGHFPERPVYPGVLIIEGMAQTAGAICIAARSAGGAAPSPELVYFMTIDGCKFRKPVLPGDVLEYHVRKHKNRGNIWKFQSDAMVGGVKVAEAEISAMLVKQ